MSRGVTNSANESTFDILGLGCVAVDDLLYVDSFPDPDTKMQIVRRERCCGGLTASALVAASRLGASCAYGGCLGDDEFSRYAASQLEREGVSLAVMYRDPAACPIISTIMVGQERGTRNIFYDLHGVRPLPTEWPDPSVLRGIQALLVDHFSVEAQTRAARVARERGVPVVADFERSDAPGFAELLNIVDHLVLSQEFAAELTGSMQPDVAARSLWNDQRSAVVITCGREGCLFLTEAGGSVQRQPAFGVKVVDTTGCGDVFHGAYAAALVQGTPIVSAIRFATAAAAIKATRPGGQAGAPRLSDVQQFLDQQLPAM